MAQVAGLEDSRQQGAPADIGTFVIPVDMIVFKHTFSGTVYVCAARRTASGWAIVSHLSDTPANVSTVIQAGLNGLTAGRTWIEVCAVMGSYILGERVDVPAYTKLDLTMAYLTYPNNVNPTPIVYQAQNICAMIYVATSFVTIQGGFLDGNGDNQNTSRNWALIWCNAATEVKLVQVHAQNSCFGVFTGAPNFYGAFCYLITESSYIEIESCFGYHSGYEIIGIRNNNHYVSVKGGRYYDGVIHTIQIADIWWYVATRSTFIIIGPNVTVYNNGANALHCITCHSTSNVWIHHCSIEGGNHAGLTPIRLLENCDNIWIEHDRIIWTETAGSHGIRIGDSAIAGTITDVHVNYNEIRNLGGAGVVYGIIIGGAGCAISDIDIIGNKILVYDSGIYSVDNTPTRILIQSNHITTINDSSGRPIDIETGLTYSQILDNKVRFSNGGGACMYLSGVTYTLIMANYVNNGNWGIYEVGACDYNRILGNDVSTIAAVAQRVRTLGVNSVTRDNIGFNPLGWAATTPAVGASNADVQNIYGFTVRIHILTIGTVTAYRITDPAGNVQAITTVLFAGMQIDLDAGAKIRFTYTVTPTWKWYGT